MKKSCYIELLWYYIAMIKISKLADYSIYIIHALMSESEPQSATKIAKKIFIPEPTVSKILKKLTQTDLLVSIQGAGGGYQLAKSAEKISLAELITAMDGTPSMTECCKKAYDCARDSVCGQQSNWRKINKKVMSLLESISVEEMK